MTLVRRLYGQFRHLIHEGAKFLVVGGIGVVITNAVYSLARHYGMGPITATTVATIVAMVLTYVGNRYWSFAHRERAGVAREGLMFIVLNGIGLLIQDAVVAFGAYALGFKHGHKIEQLIMLNLGIGIATVFRFWSYRKWVWAAPAEETPVPAVETVPSGGQPGTGAAATPARHEQLVPGNGAVSGNGHASGNGHVRMLSNGNGSGGHAAVNGHDPHAANRR